MIGFLTGNRAVWALGAALGAIALVGVVWVLGWRDARQTGEIERLERERGAWERVNDADVGSGDPDDDLEWLRRRGAER